MNPVEAAAAGAPAMTETETLDPQTQADRDRDALLLLTLDDTARATARVLADNIRRDQPVTADDWEACLAARRAQTFACKAFQFRWAPGARTVIACLDEVTALYDVDRAECLYAREGRS